MTHDIWISNNPGLLKVAIHSMHEHYSTEIINIVKVATRRETHHTKFL